MSLVALQRRVLVGLLLSAAGLALVAAPAGALTPGLVTEFSAGISTNSAPTDIAAGADGNLWFTEFNGNRIARITPSGTVTEFSAGISSGSTPAGIVAGPDGNIWFTEFFGNRVGRITPAGVVTEFSAGITANSTPSDMAVGPDGNIWFTENGGNRVARITPSGTVTEFSAGISPGSTPAAIIAGPDGNLWFTELDGNRIGRITPSGVVTEFSAGISPSSDPFDIVAGPDGNLWFTEEAGNRVARITPSGVVTEFSAGISPGSHPRGIAAGPDGNLWFAEVDGNRIGRITPSGVVTEFSAGISPSSQPRRIAAGPDGNMWFVEVAGNRVGRIGVGDAVPPRNPGSSCPPVCPPAGPQWSLTAVRAAVTYVGPSPQGSISAATVAKGAIVLRGTADRPAEAAITLQRLAPIRQATEKDSQAKPRALQRATFRIAKAGAFSHRLRVDPGLYPGRYSVTLAEAGTPPAGAPRLPAVTAEVKLAAPRTGVVQSAIIGRSVGNRAVRVFARRPALIFANFRFWALPRRGQAIRVAWYFNGRSIPNSRPANFLGRAANGRLAGVRGPLPSGRYRADLRVGRKVVARATTLVR